MQVMGMFDYAVVLANQKLPVNDGVFQIAANSDELSFIRPPVYKLLSFKELLHDRLTKHTDLNLYLYNVKR